MPLQDEIASIKKYLELEKLRFFFNYNIEINSTVSEAEIEIPSMLIQPFVENAIIHGLIEKEGDKNIVIKFDVKEEGLLCIIEDNGVGIAKAKTKNSISLDRESFGLKLAKDRIKLINESYKTDAKIRIIDVSELDNKKTGTRVEINLPLCY